jgi:hypothetical protein
MGVMIDMQTIAFVARLLCVSNAPRQSDVEKRAHGAKPVMSYR